MILTSTGRLRDFPNTKIVTAVTSVYELLPYLIRLSDVSEREARDLRKMVAMSIVYRGVGAFNLEAPAFTPNDRVENLLARPDVRVQIVDAGYWAAFQAARYRSVISDIKSVIAEIEVELR